MPAGAQPHPVIGKERCDLACYRKRCGGTTSTKGNSMRIALRIGFTTTAPLLLGEVPRAAEFPLAPYVDVAQLDVPWPKHSHYRQPWRAYLETRTGDEFSRGIGINFNVPAKEALAARLLATAGFRAARIEIGWGQVAWDEKGLTDAAPVLRRLQACREYGLRPTLLLNAHHGVPCPLRFFERRLGADATQGDRSVRLDDLAEIEPGRSGLSNLTDYMAAQVFITAIDPATRTCTLSRPLPKDLKAG